MKRVFPAIVEILIIILKDRIRLQPDNGHFKERNSQTWEALIWQGIEVVAHFQTSKDWLNETAYFYLLMASLSKSIWGSSPLFFSWLKFKQFYVSIFHLSIGKRANQFDMLNIRLRRSSLMDLKRVYFKGRDLIKLNEWKSWIRSDF